MNATWSDRISQLQCLGMTYAEIAEAAGAAPSTIGDLASGRSKSPRGDLAIRLHALHATRCAEGVAQPAEQGANASKSEAA